MSTYVLVVLPVFFCLSLPLPPPPHLVFPLSASLSPPLPSRSVSASLSLIPSRSPPHLARTHSHLPRAAPSYRLPLSRALLLCLETALPSSPAETIATGCLSRRHSSLFCHSQARGRSNYRYSVGGDAFVCSPFAASRLQAQKLLGAASQSGFCASSGRPAPRSRTRRALTLAPTPYAAGRGRGKRRGERGVEGATDRLNPQPLQEKPRAGRAGRERAWAPHCWLCAPLGSDLLSIPPACRSSSSHRTFPRSVPSSPDLPSLCTLSSYPTFRTRSSAPCPPPSHFTGDHSSLCGASPCAMICAFLERHIKLLGLL